MRFTAGFLTGVLIGCWVGAVAAVLVVETIGRAVTLPSKVRVPDEVPAYLTALYEHGQRS